MKIILLILGCIVLLYGLSAFFKLKSDTPEILRSGVGKLIVFTVGIALVYFGYTI